MTLHYLVQAKNPKNHFFQVTVRWKATQHETLFKLPSWIPGSYMIRDFARHIRSMQASLDIPSGKGKSRNVAPQVLIVREIDKDTWMVDSSAHPVGATITLQYEVYAFDRSVRTAYLDDARAFFNASSLLVCPVGFESSACELTVSAPQGIQSARLATGLRSKKIDRLGFGQYIAKDYDELIDCPVEIADFTEFSFQAAGAKHRFVITGRQPGDLKQLAKDVAAICQAVNKMFEPKTELAPFKHYVFMLNVLGNGYGGLEHRNSTALICSQADLELGSEGYRTLLGLISHEYFHAWNVKRIKPQVFSPYLLDRENYTRLLWIFEGFTSYYDDLLVLRSGAFSVAQYLNALAKTMSQVQNNPGRQHQSLEASSFYAWTKYYKQDENSPNSIVSYYTKGALVALCLDLSIRLATKQRHSLDDVMTYLWQHYGRDFEQQGRGLKEEEFGDLVERVCGLDLRDEIRSWTQSTSELPLKRLLASFGVTLSIESAETLESLLGAKFRSTGLGIEVTQVKSDSAAEQAGLAFGDTILAVNGMRATESNLMGALRTSSSGTAKSTPRRHKTLPIDILAFRADALISLTMRNAPPKSWVVKLEPLVRTKRTERQALSAWLGPNEAPAFSIKS